MLYYIILYYIILYYILYCIVLYCAISILLSSSDDLGQVEGKQSGANSMWIPQSTSLHLDATCPYQLEWLLSSSQWPNAFKVLQIPVTNSKGTHKLLNPSKNAGCWHRRDSALGSCRWSQTPTIHIATWYRTLQSSSGSMNSLFDTFWYFLQLCCTLSQLSFWLQMILMYKSIELASFPV